MLLRNKLLEEAQELAEAIEPDHVASEAADLIYFALAACARAGVKLADVEAHLDRRTLKVRRRAGDSKPYRIAAAAAFLDAIAALKGGEGATASSSSSSEGTAATTTSTSVAVGAGAGESAASTSSSGAGAMPSA